MCKLFILSGKKNQLAHQNGMKILVLLTMEMHKAFFHFMIRFLHIFQQIADTFQFGAHHSVPISLSLPQMGAFQIGPSVSYDETWYQTKTFHTWDPSKGYIDTTVEKGFYTARQMSFGLKYFYKNFWLITAKKKNSKIIAIRHEITPTLGISYKPDFNKNSLLSYAI